MRFLKSILKNYSNYAFTSCLMLAVCSSFLCSSVNAETIELDFTNLPSAQSPIGQDWEFKTGISGNASLEGQVFSIGTNTNSEPTLFQNSLGSTSRENYRLTDALDVSKTEFVLEARVKIVQEEFLSNHFGFIFAIIYNGSEVNIAIGANNFQVLDNNVAPRILATGFDNTDDYHDYKVVGTVGPEKKWDLFRDGILVGSGGFQDDGANRNWLILGDSSGGGNAVAEVTQFKFVQFAEPFLLLPLDGADGDMITVNDGTNTGTISFVGTAQLDTDEKRFGASALLLDGNSDYLTIPDSSDWDIFSSLTEDWTIDFWINQDTEGTSQGYMNQFVDGNNFWYINHTTDGRLELRLWNGSQVFDIFSPPNSIVANEWMHIAAIKVGADIGIYINGTQVAHHLLTTTVDITAGLIIGERGDGFAYFDGHMDGIRIQNENIFNANPNLGNTDVITVPSIDPVLLLPFEGADGDVTINNLGTNTGMIGFVGTAQIDTDEKKNGFHLCSLMVAVII